MSWLMYATRSTMRTILPSSVSGSLRPGVREDAVDDLVRQVEPPRDARRLLVVAEAAVDSSASSAASPAWPNGGWPMSWPSPIASVRSSFSRSARATTRAIPVVSSVCVMRVR